MTNSIGVFLLLTTLTADLFAAPVRSAARKSPSCETIEFRHHDIPKVASCIEQTAKKCMATNRESDCRRALALKDILNSLLEQPQHARARFWRMENQCRAFGHLKPVVEKDLFLYQPGIQIWNLQMTRICMAKSPLAETLTRFCLDAATEEEVAELKRRSAHIESAGVKSTLCYRGLGSDDDQRVSTYCAAGFNELCWTLLLRSMDTNEPSSVYESKVKQICQSAPAGSCNEAEALKKFGEGYSAIKNANAELHAETRKFLAGIPPMKGKPLALDFEKDPKAYEAMLKILGKVDLVLYPNARPDKQAASHQELLNLPLLYERVRVPVRSCGSEEAAEVPSKAHGMVTRVLAYQCSPHNRFRLALTGEPEALRKRLKSLPDPGPNETWFEGTLVGFRTTGVVTEIIVAVD